jgi:hypothetical protein
MRVATKRWGEVTIKKQGEGKNHFDKTRSMSLQEAGYEYTVEEYYDLIRQVTELTQQYDYGFLLDHITSIKKK